MAYYCIRSLVIYGQLSTINRSTINSKPPRAGTGAPPLQLKIPEKLKTPHRQYQIWVTHPGYACGG
ncbi:MAG: hypothetical protein ACRC62_05340 [Microcoleus sp.]